MRTANRKTYSELAALAKSIRENLANLERTLLELLAHPDATAEMIMKARQGYMDLRASLPDINRKLFEATKMYTVEFSGGAPLRGAASAGTKG